MARNPKLRNSSSKSFGSVRETGFKGFQRVSMVMMAGLQSMLGEAPRAARPQGQRRRYAVPLARD
jgi:hypothetical protein